MAKCSLSKNLHKLNFSRQQIDAFCPIMLIGYKMAELLNNSKSNDLEHKNEIDNIVNEWNVAASEFVVIMLRGKSLKQIGD